MTKKERLKVICEGYINIENEQDLRREDLTLCNLNILYDLINDLITSGTCQTFVRPVAEWLKKYGCEVCLEDSGINYQISL